MVQENSAVDAEQLAIETCRALDQQGYCLWDCSALGGEVIMIVDQEIPAAAPDGYPVYSMHEIAVMDSLPVATCRLIHVAKKQGATVISSRNLTEAEKREGRLIYL